MEQKSFTKLKYVKNKENQSKSTLKQSFKGLCTNFLYRLGGVSMLRGSSKLGQNFDSIYIFGQKFYDYQQVLKQFTNIIWFTYRKNICLSNQITSDVGWGCLIRVGQMLLANCLKQYFQIRGSQVNQSCILTAFLDQPGPQQKYSLQKIVNKGLKKYNIQIGSWYNISQVCFILMQLQNYSPMKGAEDLKIIYFNQTVIFLDQIFDQYGLKICKCQNKKIYCQKCHKQNSKKKNESITQLINKFQQEELYQDISFQDLNEDEQNINTENQVEQLKQIPSPKNQYRHTLSNKNNFDLILIVSTRISASSSGINQKCFDTMLELLNIQTSMGILGGVPGKGLYFVGSYDKNVIYLDPHLVQQSVNRSNLNKLIQTFHSQNFRVLEKQKIDSSVAFAFYIHNLQQLHNLISTLQKIKSQNPEKALISWMWQNEYRQYKDESYSYEMDIDQSSPNFSFIA